MWNSNITQVHWEPTDKCNSACPMCPRYSSDGFEIDTLANAEWTLESFKKAWPVEFIKDLKKILSCGNYGDPCACREFVDIYEYCRQINPRIGLACNTNGSLRTPEWWARLGAVMKHEQNIGNYCTFSLDGLEDTNHLYRRNTNWKKIMENAQAFIDAGGVAHWDFIVFEHNEHQVEEARDLAKQMGFKNFNVKRTTRWSGYENDVGYYPVVWKGKHLYDLRQPAESSFKHNFEDAEYFKKPNYQSITLDDFKNMVGMKNTDHRFVNGEWKQIDLNELTIACRVTKDSRPDQPFNEIFVSSSGHVAPCCFLGSEPFNDPKVRTVDENYIKMIDLNGGLDSIDMHKRNIYEILDSDIFQKLIPNTWDNKNGNNSMRPAKCGQCCGVEYNGLDFGELGDKKSAYFSEDDWENNNE